MEELRGYTAQEMGAIFRKLNANGAQVAAAGTLMSKNPVPLKLKEQLASTLEPYSKLVILRCLLGEYYGG